MKGGLVQDPDLVVLEVEPSVRRDFFGTTEGARDRRLKNRTEKRGRVRVGSKVRGVDDRSPRRTDVGHTGEPQDRDKDVTGGGTLRGAESDKTYEIVFRYPTLEYLLSLRD